MADAEAIWAAKTDDELLEAVAELSDTQQKANASFGLNCGGGLPQPDPPIGQCPRCVRSISPNYLGDDCPQCGEPFPPELLRVLRAKTPEAALVPVLRTGDPGLILLAKSLLEDEGIKYLVRGENLNDPFGGGHLGGYSYVTGPAEFLVDTPDAERASILLDGLSAATPEPAADPNDDA